MFLLLYCLNKHDGIHPFLSKRTAPGAVMNEPEHEKTKAGPTGAPQLRTIAMPADTNPDGDIFGGWILAQMDLAAGSYAISLAEGRVVTVGIKAMSFHRPVFVGDQVSCYCRCVNVGNTSITIQVESWAIRRATLDENVKVTEGMFTFVALDDAGRKRRLPKIEAE